jgi:large subunit ribosomal protein L10
MAGRPKTASGKIRLAEDHMNKISPNRQKKEKIIAKLTDKVTKAKGLVFTNYQGLTHKQLENLRKKVQTMDADFVATKNTLLKLALGKSITGRTGTTSTTGSSPRDTRDTLQTRGTLDFKNATATLFLYGDPIGPLKELAKAIKEFNLPVIKFGILDGQQMTSEQLINLSTLPSRETLLTQLVFGLKSPISNLHRALNWNMQKFVMTLKAIETKRS